MSEPENLAALKARLTGRRGLALSKTTTLGLGPAQTPGCNIGSITTIASGLRSLPHDAVPGVRTLAKVVDGLRDHPDVGLVSADVGDGFTPVVQPFLGASMRRNNERAASEDGDYAHGTLHFFRRPCVEDVGMFDPRYFAYCEEADLGLRAKAKGWARSA